MDKVVTDIPEELQKDLIALQTGEIDLQEYQRRQYMRQKEFWLPDLMESRRAGDWNAFITRALACYEVMPEAFSFFDEVPDELKYQFAIDAYMHHGDSIPAVRKAVRNALKWGRPELPKEIADAQEITVYRAGEEPIDKAKYRISWTTDKSVAEFFLSAYIGRHASHLYKGKIKPEHIICYTNDRKEQEIMQYRHVYDIEDITEATTGKAKE